jgi:predicted DNA-binding transcriptional regulator YafY
VLQTSARLLRLLSLLLSRRSWSGAELAERLEVTERTLRRDVDRLRRLGYSVDGQPGVAGGYGLAAGTHLPPLTLSDDEALAISIALRTAESSLSATIGEAALRALTKLEHVFPARLRRRANVLRETITLLERPGPRVDSDLLSLLAEACDERQVLSFEYAARNDKKSAREVEPAGLVHTGQWYLVAFDRWRDDWRTFRVDRIAGRPSRSGRFQPRPSPAEGDLRAFVSRSIAVFAYPYRADILLHASVDQVAPRVSPSAAVLERVDAKRCRISMGAHSLRTLVVWTASLGVDFEVIDPPELLEAVREIRERLDAALACGTSRG